MRNGYATSMRAGWAGVKQGRPLCPLVPASRGQAIAAIVTAKHLAGAVILGERFENVSVGQLQTIRNPMELYREVGT